MNTAAHDTLTTTQAIADFLIAKKPMDRAQTMNQRVYSTEVHGG